MHPEEREQEVLNSRKQHGNLLPAQSGDHMDTRTGRNDLTPHT